MKSWCSFSLVLVCLNFFGLRGGEVTDKLPAAGSLSGKNEGSMPH